MNETQSSGAQCYIANSVGLVPPHRSIAAKEVSCYRITCVSPLGTLIYRDSQTLLLRVLCCLGDMVVPFGPCVQVHLLRLSYYHGSFVDLEEYPL